MQKEREELLERVRTADQMVNEIQAEAAVYRKLLEDCYRAAQTATEKNDVDYLNKILHLHIFRVPSEDEVKRLGKYFLHAYIRDAGWLNTAKKSLQEIQSAAEKLDVEGCPANNELKERILEAVKDGLIPHI